MTGIDHMREAQVTSHETTQKNLLFPQTYLTKNKLDGLINECESLQKKTIQNLNKFEVDRQNQFMLNSKMDQSIEMLQELEIVESNMLNTIFMYNKLDKQ